MKRIIIIIIAALFFIAAGMCKYVDNPYSGSYQCKENSNVLNLKSNNSFTMAIVIGKNSEYMEGTYKIIGNDIELKFKKDKINQAQYNFLKGRVYGSEIIIEKLSEEFEKV